MTAFSSLEEWFAETFLLEGRVDFYLDEALAELGAELKNGVPSSSRIVVDRGLVTGQNPYSGEAFGHAFVRAIAKRLSGAAR